MSMDAVQEVIHRLEVGGGVRYLRVGLTVLAVLLLVGLYDLFCYRNLYTQEAMDSAQLARNLAQGKGYSTQFIRPLSLYLFSRRFQVTHGIEALGSNPDQTQIRTNHPDISNPPVYPMVLAGLMKVLPFHYDIPSKPQPFWSVGGRFARYQPDFLIALFNQLLFLLVVGLVFLLARRLFDQTVAWWSALLMLGTELLWRFSVSGLSTMLLLLIFVCLLWCLTWLDREINEPRWGMGALFGLAGLAGVLTGIGGLTRYAFGWVILPVVLFIMLFSGRQRVALAATSMLAFVLVLAPWLTRNLSVSGHPFGTATYAIDETTYQFPEHQLERSLEPDLKTPSTTAYLYKLTNNARKIVSHDLPRLGGTWLSAFFLVGLLVGTRNPEAGRLRYFVLACLLVLALVQAMGRTQLSEDSPEVNSENLLVLLTPMVVMFGVSLFSLFVEQVDLPIRELRYALLGLAGTLLCLPLLLALLPPHQVPVAFPPYNPPGIQESAGNYTTQDELVMSDIPWATAWYGQRQCVWLTANGLAGFYAINDLQKPIQEIYFSALTLNSMSSAQLMKLGNNSTWDSFLLDIIARTQLEMGGTPKGFPLRYAKSGWPYQFVLTYRQHPLNSANP
jgi:4-amino-4-deoxy-L-arabinose transferase-like glycosyltransferase